MILHCVSLCCAEGFDESLFDVQYGSSLVAYLGHIFERLSCFFLVISVMEVCLVKVTFDVINEIELIEMYEAVLAFARINAMQL